MRPAAASGWAPSPLYSSRTCLILVACSLCLGAKCLCLAPATAARLAEKWHEKVCQLTNEILYLGINFFFDRGGCEKGGLRTKARAKVKLSSGRSTNVKEEDYHKT